MACLSYIKTEFGVLFDYSANVENLREQIEDLSDVRISVVNRIEEDRNMGGTVLIDAVVGRWLAKASSLEKEASRIMEQGDRETESWCLMGLCPNLLSSYLASKSAKRLADAAVQLREEERRFDRVAPIVDYGECLGVQTNPEFVEFESRASVTKQIVAALKDPSVSMVGLCGMGGFGKTTLAEMIGEQLQRDGTFRFVVMAYVSLRPDLKSTQNQIADLLRIKLDAETEEGRAFQLREGLEEREKLLIILDDVWERIELKEVGIPFGSDRQNIHSPKILITSRSAQVLTWEMECMHNFPLDTLPHSDSWNFFEREVGGVDPSYLSVAAAIVDRCEGIPLLIATVAKALRQEDLETWIEALVQLKRFDRDDEFVDDAYKGIKVSYNFLRSDEIKKVFLLCGQLMCADGISIQDLLKYTIGLRLFEGRRNLREVSHRLHRCLHELKGSCLLLDDNREGTVRMHDVVRKFAISVASRDHNAFAVNADDALEEWPSQDELQYFTSFSLCYCTNLPPQLPAPFDNPFLESFLLLRKDGDDPSALKIPNNFFIGLKGLKVVSLRRMSLSPPSLISVSCLVKIRTLCLDFCELDGNIGIIGELPMLQVLSLRGSTIVYLPKEFGGLHTLKLLDLCDCSQLKEISKGVLSKLILLEELCMENSFNQWEEEVEEGCSGASLGELRNLLKLCRLDIHIPDANKLPSDLVLGNRLESFRILIGEGWKWGDDDDDDYKLRILKLKFEAGCHIDELNKGIKSLMKRAQVLYLSGLNILDMNSCVVSPDLEFLFLEHMQNVERSFHGPQFTRLESIKVEGCDRLKDLFSSNSARSLTLLKEISIEDCESMETIVFARENTRVDDDHQDDEDIIQFTHLRVLTLTLLPRLVGFYYSNLKQPTDASSLTRHEQLACDEIVEEKHPIPLFNEKIDFPKLEELTLWRIKVGKIWDDQLEAQGICCFENLTILKVKDCENLRYLCTSSMAKILAQLEKLEVVNCKSVEEIVATRGEMAGYMLSSFTKLNELLLCGLPQLKRFCGAADLIKFPSLLKLCIEDCPQLRTFIASDQSADPEPSSSALFDENVAFSNLEELIIQSALKIPDNFFIGLKGLKVVSLRRMSLSPLPPSLKCLVKIRTLCLDFCELDDDIDIIGELPMLQVLSLRGSTVVCLPKEIGRLLNLKLLDLCDCSQLKEIAKGVLSKLILLEDLRMENSFNQWEEERGERCSLEELKNLHRLINLDIHIPDAKKFPSDLVLADISTFRILIGEGWEWGDDDDDYSTILKLKLDAGHDIELNKGVNSLMKRAQVLYLSGLDVLDMNSCGGFPHLKVLFLEHIKSIERSFKYGPNFPRLETIKVEGCDQLKDLFSPNSTTCFSFLEEISIEDCENVETIVVNTYFREIIIFPQLRALTLTWLPRLIGFCYSANIVKENNSIPLFNEKVVFPRLKELTLWRIEVGKIWDDQLGAQGICCFENLTILKVKDCENLRYLCTSSMAKNLALLKKLEVVNCKSVQEIVATRGEMTEYQQLSFPNLNDLLLYGLPKLESFGGDANLIEFPSLLNLYIEDCPQLSTFISNDPSVGPELSSSVLFNEKVAFPKLEELIIQSAGQFKMIWDDELHPNSFSELVTLKIEGGTNLLIVFPPSLSSGSKSLNLQYLTIIDCDVLENVFDFGMPMKETEARSFENLKTVIASGCPALKSLFPECVALALQELEKLQIENCEKMEEIVSMDHKKDMQDQDCATRFNFPKVTSLSLCDLPQLERFYPGPHTSDWPCLDELTVLHCDKIDVFRPNIQRADASFAKIISKSKVYSFETKDITVAYKRLSGELIVNGLVSKAFPIALLPGFQNLQRLVVSSFSLEQLFPYGLLDDDSQAKILAQIQRLELIDLPKMTSIWSEHSQLNQILQNLQRLEVWGCDSLTTLAPSIALFQNLKHMDVWRCNGLTELIASFKAARSLVQLVEIRVRECDSITEIVANIIEDEDSNGDDDIVFSNLEKLTLESLTNLNSFCSARCNFKFPSLDSVTVTECPKMVFFSLGVLSTPKLTEVLVKKRCEDEEDHWDGVFNSTVFKVMVCSEEQLKFSEFPVLKNIWLDDEPSLGHCRDLKFLEVDKCTFVSYAISFRLLLLLENLEELRITNCNSLEEVFDESKLARMNRNVGLLPKLKNFFLADLPSLRHVWPDNVKLTSHFKNLSLLNICNCSSLRYVFTPSMALCVVNLQEIQVKNCARIEVIINNGEKSSSDNIMKFPELKSLLLQSLPWLASFYSRNGILDCPYLEKITMIDCPQMETFASTSSIEEKDKSLGEGALPISLEALFNDKVKFPNLEEIRIVGMDGLKMVWQNELHPDSFSKLKTVNIEKGGALLRISPSGVPRKVLLNLENLTISKCVSLEVVFDIQMLMDGRETTHSTEPAATQLRTLGISSLPKLKHVWNKDPHGLFSFAKLDSVSVEECPTLTSLFPVSVAKGLQHLEKLEIKICDGMTEIVSKKELDDHEESSVDLRFVFRKLTLFRLRRSPKLKEFYPGSHASRWPSLKSLIAYDRDNLGTIHPQFQRIQEDDAHSESQSVAGLFLSSFTKVIPNLEEVSLTSEDIDMICKESYFVADKLKVLDLKSLQEIPVAFIQRFPNLEQLIVSCSSFEQLFPSDKTTANNLARIAKLRLENLPAMKHIWNENSDHLDMFLQHLEVWNCHRLIILAPPGTAPGTAFLTNLTYLDVWRCNGMTNLVTLSTAKSLALLREMRIRECDSLKEIAVRDGEEEDSNIVFGKLQSLTLQTLASLTSFCSARCNFRFSSLYSVTVAECPRIEFFSKGDSLTPKLTSVWVKKEEEGRRGEWEGDLNSTVRQLLTYGY